MTEERRDRADGESGERNLFASKGRASAAGFSDQRSGTIERAIEAIPAGATIIPDAAEPAPEPEPTKLLVVEDDPLNLKVLTEILGYRGYRVLTARTGTDAVNMATAHRPDLVLLDLRLPEVSGLDIARRLKTDPELSGTRVIALTAYVRDWSRKAVADAGCDGYLSKPVPLAELEGAIAAALAERPVSVDGRAAAF